MTQDIRSYFMSLKYTEEKKVIDKIEANSRGFSKVYGMLLGIRIHINQMNLRKQDIPTTPEPDNFDEFQKIFVNKSDEDVNSFDFEFKAYAPIPFLLLRKSYGVIDSEYMQSLTTDTISAQLKSIGKSRSFFYTTEDDKYLIKTVNKEEMKTLKQVFPNYFKYLLSHPDTMINKLFGAYKSKCLSGEVTRFIVIQNIFPKVYPLAYRFDLKGSTVGRCIGPAEFLSPGETTWKDSEFQEIQYLKIGPHDWNILSVQLLTDVQFLSSCGLMDYSFLVGIHRISENTPFLHPAPGQKIEILSTFTPTFSAVKIHSLRPSHLKTASVISAGKKSNRVAPSLFQCSVNGLRSTAPDNSQLNEVYFFGFVDFLQSYNSRKSMEHIFKSMLFKKNQMSCVPPVDYANRLFDFLEKHVNPSKKQLSSQPTIRVQPAAPGKMPTAVEDELRKRLASVKRPTSS